MDNAGGKEKMKRVPNIPKKQFEKMLKMAPHVVVEVLIKDGKGVLLARRNITPFKGKWHLTGSFLGYNETFNQAVKRIAKREIGFKVKIVKYFGVYEYIKNDPRGHLIAHIFIVKKVGGSIRKNKENSDFRYFKKIPKDMVYFQKNILRDVLNE